MAGPVGPAAALVLLCLAVGLEASPELSGYLHKVLRNHTTHTCDGEQLLIVCPRKTTISILGAFYGRRVPSPNLCPSPGNASQESTECMSATAHLLLAKGWGKTAANPAVRKGNMELEKRNKS